MSRLLKIGYTTIAQAVEKGILDPARPESIALYHNYGDFFDDVLYFVPFGKADICRRLTPTVSYEEAAFAPHGSKLPAAIPHLWRARRRLAALMRDFRPDVVQICGPHIPALLGMLLPAVRRAPTVCFIEAYWEDILPQQAYMPGVLRRLLPYWYRLVYRAFNVYTGAPSLAPDYYGDKGMAKERIARWVQEIDLRIIDGIPREQAPAALASLPRPLVCIVGRLHPEKLAGDALDIFSRVVEQGCAGSLVVVGDGSERAALAQFAADRGLADRVLFVGQQPVRQAIAIMKACDLMIAPMQGTALVEALASGLAVVAYDHETHRAHIKDGVNGRLVPHRDIGAAARALRELIEDGAERRRLGEAARCYVSERYSFEQTFAIANDGFCRALAIAK